MTSNSKHELLILGYSDVLAALDGQEDKIIDTVSDAYQSHACGHTVLPHSSFLRFPNDSPNRIIALPALLEGSSPIAGLKWIASFPQNVTLGIDRASAILIVNSVETGQPIAVLESSVISARRTAASAALAARTFHDREETCLGLIGCGVINFEGVRFLQKVLTGLKNLFLYDISLERAEIFKKRIADEFSSLNCVVVASCDDVFNAARLVCLATVASTPHIDDAASLSADSTLLHLSLRDLSPTLIRAADNIVDDIDHVLRAQTSLHLTEQEQMNHDFIRCSLADVLMGKANPRVPGRPVVFSPFGLGILDLAVARLILEHAYKNHLGIKVRDFLPKPWFRI